MTTSNLKKVLEVTSGAEVAFKIGKDLEQRLTGRFYTHARIGQRMASELASRTCRSKTLSIIDPFCGDGRLLCWTIEALHHAGKLPTKTLHIEAWDCDEAASRAAKVAVIDVLSRLNIVSYSLETLVGDSFELSQRKAEYFDICVTNPPWETIKPDTRELAALDTESKETLISLLKEKVFRLEKAFPHSKSSRKFSGWGANLARFGIEASAKLVRKDGLFGIVAPASIFGDQISTPLRIWLFTTSQIKSVHHYPAEAKLFDSVDQAAIYFIGHKQPLQPDTEQASLQIFQHAAKEGTTEPTTLELTRNHLEEHGFAIGFNGSTETSQAVRHLATHPRLGDYEARANPLFKLGRELDETGIASKLTDAPGLPFVKGRFIGRYTLLAKELSYLRPEVTPPVTAALPRVIWRDVARQSSARRMIATLLPPGMVTGNSINVLFPKPGSEYMLPALVGILNSIIFEAQVRASISTNHLSVGAIRKIRVPDLDNEALIKKVGSLVEQQLNNPKDGLAAQIEVEVARWYALPHAIYEGLLIQAEKNCPAEVAEIRLALQQAPNE